MNKHTIQRLAQLVALACVLTSQAKAGTINDPVITVLGTSTLQQTLSVSISISGAPTGTIIYYTTDGSNPSMSSPSIASGGSILIAQNAMLQVEAFQNATTTSDIVTEQLTLAGQVSAGTAHTLILENNGTVLAAGDNSAGELGNGTNNNASTPVQVMVNASTYLTGIVAVAADNDESFAVDNTGKVWAWGLNTNSQLGIGTSSNALFATQVTSLSNIVAIASSQNHTLAVGANGSVFGWGANTSGQVGNGATSSWVTMPTPVLAPSGQSGNLSGVVAVAAGASHSLALDKNGDVWSWGSNSAGQLGDTTTTSRLLPVEVQSGGTALTNIVAIAAGTSNSYAESSDPMALAWGDNTIGELGNGTTSATPVTANLSAAAVSGLNNMLVAVSNQSALDSTGTFWTWGDNSTGKLGVGITGYYATLPLAVTLGTQGTPTLTATAGNGQTVNDGTFSSQFQIKATSGGTALPNTWVDFVVNPTYGALGLTSGATQLSPIIGGYTNSSGQISFYLDAPSNGSGSVPLTALSGATQYGLTAVEQMAQSVASSGEPTMPQELVIILGASVLFFGVRRKLQTIG
jgi:alpha-tubulin suppressor-like RCC1 family protein